MPGVVLRAEGGLEIEARPAAPQPEVQREAILAPDRGVEVLAALPADDQIGTDSGEQGGRPPRLEPGLAELVRKAVDGEVGRRVATLERRLLHVGNVEQVVVVAQGQARFESVGRRKDARRARHRAAQQQREGKQAGREPAGSLVHGEPRRSSVGGLMVQSGVPTRRLPIVEGAASRKRR